MKYKRGTRVIYIDKDGIYRTTYKQKGEIYLINKSCRTYYVFINGTTYLCFPEQIEIDWEYYKLKKLIEHGV